jgi:hypothetical protein
MSIRQGVTYGDAETRGRLRQWKKKLAHDYTLFDAAFRELQDGKSFHLAEDMVQCTRVGRQRAFDRINRSFGPGATLESARLGRNNRSMAIWSILKPRDATAMAAYTADMSETERGSLLQDCVTVNYVVVGCVSSTVLVAEGLWTLEVPDHALGRAVERSRLLHPGVLIREAHLNLLDLPAAVLNQPNFTDSKSPGVYIKAGSGCFAGYFQVAEDVSIGGRYSASVRLRTWLDADQLFERQIILCEKGEPGTRLGDTWLRPHPLCRIERAEAGKLQLPTQAEKPL